MTNKKFEQGLNIQWIKDCQLQNKAIGTIDFIINNLLKSIKRDYPEEKCSKNCIAESCIVKIASREIYSLGNILRTIIGQCLNELSSPLVRYRRGSCIIGTNKANIRGVQHIRCHNT